MTTISELHNDAMEKASLAEILRRKGDAVSADALFEEAFEREKEAALLLKDQLSAEPTRSVLFRSAASLALDCNKHREAEQLIGHGLAGNPPDEIADELRDLYETVTFQRHLLVNGTTLRRHELQMSLAGDAVGFGLVSKAEYLPRIASIETLLVRTTERQSGIPFREAGRPQKAIADQTGMYIGVPRAASFAVTIRIGRPLKQRHLFSELPDTVTEILECMALYSAGDVKRLRDRIGNTAYYRNFISLAKTLEPDGKRVRTVGFTSESGEQTRKVSLKHVPSEIWVSKKDEVAKHASITGTLISAHKDEKKTHKNVIGIKQDDGQIQSILVPKGLMNDIVRPNWDLRVVASCQVRQNVYRLIGLKQE